jgi:hypothetical protein
MLTIIAWLVFVPALGWNVLFFLIAFDQLVKRKGLLVRNLIDALVSLALLLVPGVYLFGWF